MDETSSFRKWRYIAIWLVILLIFYGWQIVRMGGIRANLTTILSDWLCILPVFLLIWMAFFSQFMLPVRTFHDRRKIFERLIAYLFGQHGPALFVENGVVKEHSGERLKKGPGVVWLDSASGAVTRTAVEIKQTLGPGVHFLEKGEFIAGTVDLHIQTHRLGPKDEDEPFGEKPENMSDAEWKQIQDRRKQVSAWTRDGIEVVPNITVTFRLNTGFPKEGQPGSRFGYRTGPTKKDKENEEKDKEAIRKAILGEGINPYANETALRRVAWNELPASLAVDVWREYVAKFTLDELFKQDFELPPSPVDPPQPTEEEIEAVEEPVLHSSQDRRWEVSLVAVLGRFNNFLKMVIQHLEPKREDAVKKTPPSSPMPNVKKKEKEEKKTALQVITSMVKARLTQAEVADLDDYGRIRGKEKIQSKEYDALQKRGLIVQNVSISNIRLAPDVDKHLIDNWSATWLAKAKYESEQIERKRSIIETKQKEETLINYAVHLSREINRLKREGKLSVKEALKALLIRIRAMIRSGPHSEQLRRRMSAELEEIENILKWVEENGR